MDKKTKESTRKNWNDFVEWYQQDEDKLLEWAKKEVESLDKKRKEFLKEWPLKKLSTLSFSQLATNLPNSLTEEEKNNNLFTQLSKNGKYDFLMSLGQARTTSKIKYVDGKEKVNFNSNKTDDFTEKFNFSEITQQFHQKISELLALKYESDGFFNTNEYSVLLIKLVCLYSEKNDIFIPDNSISKDAKKSFFNPIIPKFSKNRYKINHQILSAVSENIPELSDSWILNILLYKFGEEVAGTPWNETNNDEDNEPNVTEDDGEKLVMPKKY